ncbi:MAG: septum formation protein Maf [Candidatus Omnitrophica bacterium]|nr:septum formation protein Maf [Candidatus Omnitrophota bacterium]
MSSFNFAGIILASQSPRRKTLLEKMNIPFKVAASRIIEIPCRDERPGAYSTRMALEKAMEAADSYPDHLVIGADTVVAVNDMILGKPSSPNEAIVMLSRLSGQWHEVWTGICLYHKKSGAQALKAVCSKVRFKDLTEEEITRYVQTGEPMDKAGAYAIQGKGKDLVRELKGSYHNVIGLPTFELAKMLEDLGVSIDSLPMETFNERES